MQRLPTPALDEIEELMQEHGVEADLQRVAALVLDIFREKHPPAKPAELSLWIEQLAVDVVAARKT
jgi:hypothetical protein